MYARELFNLQSHTKEKPRDASLLMEQGQSNNSGKGYVFLKKVEEAIEYRKDYTNLKRDATRQKRARIYCASSLK